MNPLGQITQRLLSLAPSHATTLVAIDGKGGAGKSTLADTLVRALTNAGRRAEIVHIDDFYLPSADRPPGIGAEKPVGGDFDWRRLRDEVLVSLREGREAVHSVYDWERDVMGGMKTVRPGGIVIVEGVTTGRVELREFFDFHIWVDCPRNVRLARGIGRDGEEALGRWEWDWMPAEDRYVEKHRPHESVDMIVNGTIPY